jgi:hypothetical protein
VSQPATLPPGEMRGGADRWILAAVLLLAAGSLAPIWAVSYPPLQDLPNHLLKVDLLERFLRGEVAPRAVFAPNLKPLSNATCYVAILLLAPLFGKMGAAKIFLSACLVLLPVAAFLFLRRVNPGNAILALAVPPLGFSLFLMMGNLNFCLALALYLLCLAALSEPKAGALGFSLPFAILATLLYFTHGFVFLALAVAVSCLLIVDYSEALLRTALGLIPGLLLMGTTLLGALSPEGGAGALRPAFSRPGLDSIRLALVWLLNPHGWGFDTPFALGWVAAMTACGLWTLWEGAGRSAKRGEGRRLLRENRWLVVGGLLIVGYLAAPDQLRDWFHLRMRFSPLAVLTLLGGMKLPPRRAVRAGMAVVLLAACLAALARNFQEFRRQSADVEEYVTGMEAVEEGSSLLPVENLEPGPKYRPNLHSWAYYVMEKGGWSPYLHAQPSYNPVTYVAPPWGPGEGMPLPSDPELRRVAACYDFLILWNPKDGDARALRPYFDLVRASRRLRIWRNRGGLRRALPSENRWCRLD